jgi:hypothetical protein
MTISEENWDLKNGDKRRVAAKGGGPSILRFGLYSADSMWGCPEPPMLLVDGINRDCFPGNCSSLPTV